MLRRSPPSQAALLYLQIKAPADIKKLRWIPAERENKCYLSSQRVPPVCRLCGPIKDAFGMCFWWQLMLVLLFFFFFFKVMLEIYPCWKTLGNCRASQTKIKYIWDWNKNRNDIHTYIYICICIYGLFVLVGLFVFVAVCDYLFTVLNISLFLVPCCPRPEMQSSAGCSHCSPFAAVMVFGKQPHPKVGPWGAVAAPAPVPGCSQDSEDEQASILSALVFCLHLQPVRVQYSSQGCTEFMALHSLDRLYCSLHQEGMYFFNM